MEIIEQSIKEAEFVLNTGSENEAELVTPFINGKLKVILINSNGADIKIAFDRFRDITLFRRLQVNTMGWEYFPLAVQRDTGHEVATQQPLETIEPDIKESAGQKWTFNATEWILNDRLYIKISGGINTEVSFILRWE